MTAPTASQHCSSLSHLVEQVWRRASSVQDADIVATDHEAIVRQSLLLEEPQLTKVVLGQ